jgi:hypothetical protein
MTTEKYNGWSNYETWNVKLWLDNDQGSDSHFCGRAQDLLDETDVDDCLETRRNDATDYLARELEEYYDEIYPEVSGVFGDLLRTSLGRVDWHEIASAYVEELEPANSSDDEETDE